MFLTAAQRLTRHSRYGRTIKTTRMKCALLGWAVIGIFPVADHAADSLLGTTLEDTKLYFTSPLRWDETDWLYFGGALVAIGAAHSFDERVRDHFATGSKATSANEWGKGGDSFPSLHTTVAFAVGTVFAESGNDEYRWIRRIVGYGVASATAYVRTSENVHWLSDSVAGAALGIATARFVLNRQEAQDRAALQFQPVKNGWLISYSVRTH
jgi:hypothetical protein